MKTHLGCVPHCAWQTSCRVTFLAAPPKRSRMEQRVGNWNKGKLDYDTDGVEEWLAGFRKRESRGLEA